MAKTIEEFIEQRIVTEKDGYSEGRVSLCVIADIAKLYANSKLEQAAEKARITRIINGEIETDGLIMAVTKTGTYEVNKQSILNLREEV